MRQLLRAGAKPELTDMEGKTAIDYADAAGFDEAVEQLERIAATTVPTATTTAPLPTMCMYPAVRVVQPPAQLRRPSHATATRTRTRVYAPAPVQAQGSCQNPPPSQRGGGMTNRGGGGGGGTARMTPRVPNGGDIAPKMTPRMPVGGHGAHRPGFTPRGSKPSEPVVLRPEQVATLDRDTMKFLTKKLVHLTVLLEQDTVADDAKYPSFYSV